MPENTEKQKLRNPRTGTVAEFGPRQAKVRIRQGWEPVKNTAKKKDGSGDGAK